MYLSDALGLFKYWERTPPAFVSLHRIALALVGAPKDATNAPARGLPTERADSPHYVRPTPSSKEEVLAMQARISAFTGAH